MATEFRTFRDGMIKAKIWTFTFHITEYLVEPVLATDENVDYGRDISPSRNGT